MLKQLNAGIVSLGLASTMTAPLMAQEAISMSPETNSVPTNNLLVEDYSNLYTSVPQVESEVNTLTVKNTLDFSNIPLVEDGDAVALQDIDILAQRRTRSRSKYKYSAGFDFPINFGWVKDSNGVIDSILGFNLGLGIGYRKYINPKGPGKFNFGWHVGTIALIIPLVGVFGEYQWDQGWYVGGSVNIFPVLAFTNNLFFPIPAFQAGYRWK